jgi:hypothetical protein
MTKDRIKGSLDRNIEHNCSNCSNRKPISDSGECWHGIYPPFGKGCWIGASRDNMIWDGAREMEIDSKDFDYLLYGDRKPVKNEIETLVERYRISTSDKDKVKIKAEIIEKFGFKINEKDIHG